MIISIIQADLIWEAKSENLQRLEELISTVRSGTDIVILPEMFNSGFTMNAAAVAEIPGSVTFGWMRGISRKMDLGICGSYIMEKTGSFFNTFVFVSPEGEMYSYDKRHLFSPGKENKHFTPGKERVVFRFRGVRICPTICYDLRFPVWSRNRNDYDLLINCANWPEGRKDVWATLLRARAIENQCYVAGANRIGIDGAGIGYCGESMITGPRGEILASGSLNTECVISAEISLIDLQGFRKKFPVWKDADKFEVHT